MAPGPLTANFNGHWRVACPYQGLCRHSAFLPDFGLSFPQAGAVFLVLAEISHSKIKNRPANSATPMLEAGQTGPEFGFILNEWLGRRNAARHKGRHQHCCERGGGSMTGQSHETPQDLRNLVRVVSACTLGLWAFAAGLLIGVFLFS